MKRRAAQFARRATELGPVVGIAGHQLQALRGHWGEADFPELMACVDAVIATGYIDEKRLGVTGGSYGGYMTNWVLGHTQRFAGAVTQRCVSNLVSMSGSSDFALRPVRLPVERATY